MTTDPTTRALLFDDARRRAHRSRQAAIRLAWARLFRLFRHARGVPPAPAAPALPDAEPAKAPVPRLLATARRAR